MPVGSEGAGAKPEPSGAGEWSREAEIDAFAEQVGETARDYAEVAVNSAFAAGEAAGIAKAIRVAEQVHDEMPIELPICRYKLQNLLSDIRALAKDDSLLMSKAGR